MRRARCRRGTRGGADFSSPERLRMLECGTNQLVRRLVMPKFTFACLALVSMAGIAAHAADQADLQPVLNDGEQTLKFDWPAIEVGTGEYEEGPTGVTVFHFP